MTTKLRSRPSHYEVLGLTPSASSDEISAAFARKMSLFRARPLSDLAQVTAAYDTLRNPSKRRDYDRSLEPKREPERLEWSFRAAQQSWSPFMTSARALGEVPNSAERPLEPHVTAEPNPEADPQSNPDPDPQPNPGPQPNPAPDPRIESISASLRALAESAAPAEPSSAVAQAVAPALLAHPEADRRIKQRPEASLDQLVDQIRSTGRAEKDRMRDAPRLPLDWKRPIWLAGGLIVGVGMLGGIAGVAAGGDAHGSVTVAVPAAKPVTKVTEPSAELASSLVQVPKPSARPQVATARIASSPSSPRPAVLDSEPVQVAADASSESQADSLPSDPLAPIPAAAPAAAASLPLSNALIARTIDRIGYPCGEVASAAPADAEGQGVFKITCSSGHTYQAAPVHGRYRFRRWDRR